MKEELTTIVETIGRLTLEEGTRHLHEKLDRQRSQGGEPSWLTVAGINSYNYTKRLVRPLVNALVTTAIA
jgi:hypothetical protein